MATMLAFISLLGLLPTLELLTTQPAIPQFPKPPLVRHTFATTEDGWLGMGEIAKVSRTVPPQPVLHFEYMVRKANLNALVRPMEAEALKGAQRLHFAIKTDTDTTIAILLQEKGGGRFTAVANLPKNLWQDIDLSPTEFSLGKDKDDPVDANGKLDLDKVETISLVDLHVFLVQAEGAPTAMLFPGIVSGPREFWLKEFTATTEPLPAVSLDGLGRPHVGWIGIGGLVLQRAPFGHPLGGKALEATYAVGPGKIAGLVRALSVGTLTEKTGLSLSLASQKSVSLLVQLEDDQGGKFDTTIEVPGLKTVRKPSLAWSDFKPNAESKRDKLDPARVKQVLILDISGLLESVEQNNTLWLANLEAK